MYSLILLLISYLQKFKYTVKSTICIHVQLDGSKQMKLIVIFSQAVFRLELINTKNYCKNIL